MGRSFFHVLNLFSCVFFVVQLFLPIYIKAVAHYDMNRKKFCFSIYLFSFIKIVGGYIATYNGGMAIHVSDRKAFLLPYSQMNAERKKFSFMSSFHLHSFSLTTETGAEYLFPMAIAHAILRSYLYMKVRKRKKIANNLLLTNGDVLKISLKTVAWFNLFMLLQNFIIFLKEKITQLWRRKIKKSII